jgi:tetratricopeptide (TPR) repeat protein
MSINKKFIEFIQKEIDSGKVTEDKLAIIYKCLNNGENAKKLFRHVASINFPTTRFWGLDEKQRDKINLLIQTGELELITGVQLNLAFVDVEKANQLFEWAAENCFQSDEDIAAGIKYELYDEIAVGFLWRGYALLNLDRYDEAYELLAQVIPYLNKYKKLGIEMWRKVEYALPKALVPLCEYKLDPTQENLQKAQVGIEDYIKSLRDNKDKLEGYLYYFHLKEVFSDVYNTEIPDQITKVVHRKELSKKIELPPDKYDFAGSVIVFDMESGSLEVFGTQNELEEYVKKVERLANYPVLSGLMELYVTDAQQEPEPLIEECKRLLSDSDADPDIKEKTRYLLNVAQDAKNAESTVMLYFDPKV